VRAAAIAIVLGGCFGGVSGAEAFPPDGDGSGGNGELCSVSLTAAPATATAGPGTTIRVMSHVFNGPGTLTYRWTARFNGGVADAVPVIEDPSQLDVRTPSPGVYDVTLEVTGAPTPCSTGVLPINIRAPGARSETLRLRITPPQSAAAPPYEKLVQIDGGATLDIGTVAVDQGVIADVVVSGPDGGVPAYLRFAPAGTPDAVVEVFADDAGHAVTRLVAGTHSVLVVPLVATAAPRRIDGWSSSSSTLAVDAGVPVTGVVRDPAGAVLDGAKVQVSVDDLPSAVATTAAGGSFALRAASGGASVTVEVTPPNASGLPRLSATATSTALDLRMPLQIRYAANVTLKNLAGTVVRRQGAPVPGAGVTVVGSLAAVGTVTAGTSGAPVSATGEVRITATSDGSGALPAMLVPASAALSAVIAVAAGDLAVTALDTSGGRPASLDAPALQPIITAVFDTTARLPGAVLDVVPAGALAMAAAPALHVIADGSGAVTAALASGGHYDLRLHDPMGRGAPLVIADRTATTIATSYHLPVALQVRGTVKLGGTQPLAGASIQFLCDRCTGIERVKPIAEVASDGGGRFALAVPDPGTM
jgi:hypothetical protein